MDVILGVHKRRGLMWIYNNVNGTKKHVRRVPVKGETRPTTRPTSRGLYASRFHTAPVKDHACARQDQYHEVKR
jgi:hypothetical protein